MLKSPRILAALIFLAPLASLADPAADKERLSYSVGADVARQLTGLGAELDAEAMAQGLRDALAGNALKHSDEVIEKSVQEFQMSLMKKQQADMDKAATEMEKTGVDFQKKFGEEKGTTKTASGLMYQVITQGQGPKPKATDTVRVHYTGTHIDGTVFDSSVQRGQPISFPLNQVIPGWTEGVQLMAVGSKFKFVIPPNLGYGPRGAPPVIGPNSTLVFVVELLGIE